MKLYLWENHRRDYSFGLAFAIAKDEVEARKLIEKKVGYEIQDWGDLSIHPLNKKIGRSVCGGG